ncbi:MAG: hypothetical protein ACREBJ_12130 [Nitrosotalea sp.]
MRNESKALIETQQNLAIISDILESIRSKYKGQEAKHLLNSQEYLAASIDALNKASQVIKENQRKEARQQRLNETEYIEQLDNWKKSEEEKIKRSYLPQFSLLDTEKVDKKAKEMLQQQYKAELQRLEEQYKTARNRGEIWDD